MAIERVEYAYKKAGTRWDAGAKKHIGYRIDLRINGKRVRQAGFSTRKEAEDFISRIKANRRNGRFGLPQVSHITLADLLDKRLAVLVKKPERVRGERVFQEFRKLVGNPKLENIRTAHFQAYINHRLETVSPESVIREIAMLSVAFRSVPELYPELDDYIPPKIPRPKRDRRKKTKHVITESELGDIVAHLQDTPFKVKVGRMFRLAWFLGLRYGEVVRLKKTDFRAKDRTLRVYRPKTDDVTVFEDLPEEVVNLLTDAIVDSEGDVIFPTTQIYPNAFYLTLRAAVEAAGLVYGRVKGVSFHGTRHSFVTRMMQVTDMATTQSLSGHSTATMIAHYSHSTASSRKAALRTLYGSAGLREIYDKIRDGSMSFEEFKRAVKVA